MKSIQLTIVFLFVVHLGIIGHVGCSWLRQNLPSSEKEIPSGKGMVCVYRIDSPGEYGAECPVKLSLNKKVVCTLPPGEYWSGASDPAEVSISASVNFDNVEGRKGGASATRSCEVEADQPLYLRVVVPRLQEEEVNSRIGPVVGNADEIKDCICDGKKFSPPQEIPEGSSLLYIYRLSSPDERGPEYPCVVYLNDKRACTLRPGEFCAHRSEAEWTTFTTTLHKRPMVDDGVPTLEVGSSCSVDGSPTVGFCCPTKPGEIWYIRIAYPKDPVDYPPPLQIEMGKRDEMTGCKRLR